MGTDKRSKRLVILMVGGVVLVIGGLLISVFAKRASAVQHRASSDIEPISLSEEEWRERLTEEEFRVLREEGTEPAGSSPLNREERKGVFVCAGCHLELFPSEYKFESGTGWPSFYDVIDGHVETKVDYSLILPRTEYHCARCGGHQGHIFEDGPEPTGLRYCNNGVALDFIPANPASK